MIDRDALLGVLRALAEEVEVVGRVDLPAYRDRIVALAEDVGICGAIAPGGPLASVQCDLTDGHHGMHSGLDWSALHPEDIGEIVTPRRLHWSPLSGAERRTR